MVGLRKKFQTWSTETTKEATKNLGKFRRLIKVRSRTAEEGGKLKIVSTGESLNKKKPVARAYEYGSGVRSRSSKTSPKQQGSRGFVRIAPKRRKALAFFWDKVDENTPAGGKFLGISGKTGKAMFRFVDHPGVTAANSGKGYIGPAFAKTHRKIAKELGPEVKKAVVGTFRKAFANAK